jgi:TonB dependent receptor-like, beta-barrel
VRRDLWSFISLFPASGTFNFDNTFTSANATNTSASGNGFASFLLGYPTTANLGTANTAYQVLNSQGWYAADTFQLNPKLTLNLGLRWDQPGAFSEKHDNHAVLLPDGTNPLAQKTGLPLKGQLALVDSQAWPNPEEQVLHWNLFSPRIGVAYRVTEKTVIRAGYGMSYLPYSIAQNGPNISAVNLSSTTMVTTLNGGLTPYATMSNPFPNGLVLPAGRTAGFLDSLGGQAVEAPIPDQSSPYVQQWNINFQRDLGSSSMFQIGYAGSKGTHLPFSVPNSGVVVDQLPPQYFALGSDLLTQVPNPFYGILPSSVGLLGQKTIARGYLLRPYPQYLNLLTPQINAGGSSYNALQATFQKRFTGGGTVVANYTWSKLISNTDTLTGYLEARVNPGAVQNWYDLSGERSLVSQDVPQRLVVSYVYDIPMGKGKRFLGGSSGVVDGLLSGWSINGATTLQKGYPLAFTAQANALAQFGAGTFTSSTSSAGTIRPNVVAGCQSDISGSAQSRLNQWFNTACFSQPGNFSLGTASRTDPTLRGSGVANWDFAVAKKFKMTEAANLQFYTQFFNMFNRVQFLAPNTQVGNPNFGKVTAALNQPRLIQFGLRFAF